MSFPFLTNRIKAMAFERKEELGGGFIGIAAEISGKMVGEKRRQEFATLHEAFAWAWAEAKAMVGEREFRVGHLAGDKYTKNFWLR